MTANTNADIRPQHSGAARPCRVCGTTAEHAFEDNCEGWPTGEDLRCVADRFDGAAADDQAICRAATKIENLESLIESYEAALHRERERTDQLQRALEPGGAANVLFKPIAPCVGQVRGPAIDRFDDGDD